MPVEERLNTLSKPQLVQLVIALYGRHADTNEVIDRHLARTQVESSKDSLATLLQRQIKQIRQEDEFIEYRSSNTFAHRLDSILTDINTLLRPSDLVQALKLTEDLLDLSEVVFNRADDSDGAIGEVMGDGINQWLDIAAELRGQKPEAAPWVDKVKWFFDNNDYGCFDNVISHSRKLLTEAELRELAIQFESATKQRSDRQKSKTGYDAEAAHNNLGMRSVAEALGDMNMFEASILARSPEPNRMQIENIIQFAMRINDLDRAGYWLDQPTWKEDRGRRESLRYDWLERLGDIDRLKHEIKQDLLNQPNTCTLERYWKLADEQERQTIKLAMETLGTDRVHLNQHIDLLLAVGSLPMAASAVRNRASEISGLFYGSVSEWADIFESNDEPLAAVLCYRALLSDLLKRGYARAYHHGARYFHKLLALDKQIADYGEFENAQAFIRTLQAQHGRKRSFWAEANYPNKGG